MFKEIIIYMKTAFLLQIRETTSLFFSLLFPIIMTILFVTGFNNSGFLGDFNYINKYIFIAISISLIANTVISIPMSFLFDFKDGYLKQLKILNVNVFAFKAIDIIVSILFMYIEFIIIILFSILVYDLEIKSIINIVYFLILLFPCMLSLIIFSTSIANLFKKPYSYMTVGLTLMMILFAFSGVLGFDLSGINTIFKSISEYIPTYYVVNDFDQIWNGLEYNLFPYLLSSLTLIGVSCIIFIITKFVKGKKQ